MSSYAHTLLLPRPNLPARADLVHREPETLTRWRRRDLLAEHARDPDRDRSFVLHDGPPYANGPAHLGHVLNKCLKDFVVRSRVLEGYRVPVTFGWDCHGLPVERAVLDAHPELAGAEPLALRAACRDWALRWQAHQRAQFARALVLTGSEVYRTLDPAFEASTLELFADLVVQGLVYRALRPVRWSLGNHTALAEAELQYADRRDPSLWVDFACHERLFGQEATVYLTAWTTTPWTLPANLALAVDPDATYALVDDGQRLRVVAAAAVPRLEAVLGTALVVLDAAPGASLVGVHYEPLLTDVRPEGAFVVLAGDHVDDRDGSGVVHTAPGHGPEDHVAGMAAGLPAYCPLRADGTLDATVPEVLRGCDTEAANAAVVDLLAARGALAGRDEVTHSVALDWRGGARVVYRATPQWFVALDAPTRHGSSLREGALAALDDVRFHPESGRQRLTAMLRDRPDWCLSRQRAWGLPLPAFYRDDGSALLTPETVRAVADQVRAHGADVWFRATPVELLGDLHEPGLTRGDDVLDVWFESGASWRAVLGGPEADTFLEGSDQHRGWFQHALLLAVAATGQAPFREVVTHGFLVDGEGYKLSKSAGNGTDVDEVFGRHGAEVVRWWAATSRYEADVKVDEGLFDLAASGFRKVRHTLRFAVANTVDLDVAEGPAPPPESPEAWLLGELDGLVAEVRGAYETHAHAVAARALLRFCAETLSARYLDAVKDRLYCDAVDSPRRRRSQRALFRVVDVVARLLAPLLPHTADEVYRALHGLEGDGGVHDTRFPEAAGVAVHPAWVGVASLRPRVLAALEAARRGEGPADPLDAGLSLPDPDGRLAALDRDDLADWFGVSRVALVPGGAPVVHDLRDQPRCARSRRRTADVREWRPGQWLSRRDASVLGLLDDPGADRSS